MRLRWRAHPRSRGDHGCRIGGRVGRGGSSPLARGPPRLELLNIPRLGLIPARAGTTPPMARLSPALRAHPRSRGDHLDFIVNTITGAGSSPLARGPLHRQDGLGHFRGLIPARAGTTYCRLHRRRRPGAHPRSRGDHCADACRLVCQIGSSPLARGPPEPTAEPSVKPGLIPARAGTT